MANWRARIAGSRTTTLLTFEVQVEREKVCFRTYQLLFRVLTQSPAPVYCYVPEYTGLNTDGLGASNTTLTKRAFGLSLNNGSFNFTTTE